MDRIIQMDEVIANAATIIPKEDREARNMMRQWAYLGARELLNNKADIETEEITITNLVAPKPKYFIRGMSIALFNSDGEELNYRFKPSTKDRIHINTKYNYIDDSVRGIVSVSEQEDAYILDSLYGDDVAQFFLRYYKLPIDPQTDEPYFYSEQLLALMMFIRYMYFLRQGDTVRARESEQMWLREQHKAKMRNKIPDGLEMREIGRTWNSMIQKKFYDKF